MKALKSIKNLSLVFGLMSLAVIFSSVKAQEYDDMYFNKSDRKTVKVEKNIAVSDNNKSSKSSDYKKITESTETYSSKNINPEYIARYKSTESNEINDKAIQKNTSYSSDDYFVEGYDQNSYVGDTNRNGIDYTALALRDQMSYSNHNRSYSSPSWRFSPYMSMGMGMGIAMGQQMGQAMGAGAAAAASSTPPSAPSSRTPSRIWRRRRAVRRFSWSRRRSSRSAPATRWSSSPGWWGRRPTTPRRSAAMSRSCWWKTTPRSGNWSVSCWSNKVTG